MEMAADHTTELLSGWLRAALRHLYDPQELRRSPLIRAFGLERQSSPSALRQLLIDAIEALKPAASASPQSDAWRIYRTLSHRYVEQFSQEEVAGTFGLSIRQLRRLERLALRALAEYLLSHQTINYERLQDESAPVEPADEEEPADDGPEGLAGSPQPSAAGETASTAYGQELEWVGRSAAREPASLSELLAAALKTMGALIHDLSVQIERDELADLPEVAVQVPTTRQALLNALATAVRASQNSRLAIRAAVQGRQVCLRLRCAVPSGGAAWRLERDSLESLEMAKQLLGFSGGCCEHDTGVAGDLTIEITLPVAADLAVLVVDDNADTLMLFQRHLAGTPYPVFGAGDPEQALQLATKIHPGAIVLDVMLPGIDGWELLGRLREHPDLQHVPVIVCTVLPQEQLALSLGAAAFLRKPVTRQVLLSTLDSLLTHPC